ncbi:phage holin family protein [Rhodoferax sp.]|uniref:phage holin family protein n=1 Tax=Rhodoferax sp. TaxID=50421 RepID=UPI00262F65C2|nr:phage holin family protein [Rhodoferax sp.]MDD2808106.1 phage holin family protein [Rhodoferax sp.]
MHPLLALLTRQPQLLADHAQAYTVLFHEELALARSAWQRQLTLRVVALGSLGAALLLGGMAVMLWAVTPLAGNPWAWALFVVPLLPLALAVVCFRMAREPQQRTAFANLWGQIKADLALCRAVTPS